MDCRDFLKLLLAGLLLALLAPVASADHQFGPGVSGFAKAKWGNRQSITVCDESIYGFDVAAIIAPWNRIAGWPLFVQSCPGDVTFTTYGTTWVLAYPSYREAYTSCTIYASEQYATTHWMRHEIGHCLGFSDHIFASLLSDPRYNNPDLYGEIKVCDDWRSPYFSPYRGIMSYCTPYPWQWFQAPDIRMLTEAGYR